MQVQFLTRSFLLLLGTVCLALALQDLSSNNSNLQQRFNQKHHNTQKRAIGHYKKPGFFRTLFSVIYEQWSDTKNTLTTVNKMINDNFLPEDGHTTPAPTTSSPNASTTPAPYRITRSEFNKILGRNWRGLVRLFNIELNDALKQSEKTNQQHKKNASVEVSKFL